jgi:hypothetical protein
MWAIIALAFAAWLFWLCNDFWLLHTGHSPKLIWMVQFWPYIILNFASNVVDNKVGREPPGSPLPVLILLFLFTIGGVMAVFMLSSFFHALLPAPSSATNWLMTNIIFWVMATSGLLGIILAPRHWSRRLFAFKPNPGAPGGDANFATAN